MSEPAQADIRQWLSGLARNSQRWIRITVLAGALAGLATILQMVLLAWLVHQIVIDGQPAAGLTAGFAALIGVLLLRAAGQGLQSHFAARCSEQVRRDARRQLHRHWQDSGPVALADDSAGTLTREWLDHVEALHGYFARFMPQMSLAVIIPIAILILVFWLDWLAGIFLLLSAPLIPLFMALVGMGAEKVNQQHFEIIGRLSGQFLDKVRGLTTLQLFGQTRSASETLHQRSDQYRRITLKTLKVAFLSSAVLEFFASVAIAVIAIYIGFGLLGYITYGPSPELTLFSGLLILLLAPEFFQPLRILSQHYHDRAAALGAGSEILARLNQPVAGLAKTTHPTETQTDDIVALTSITLSYPGGKPVLSELNLSAQRGQSMALTGPSGGGKSSLLHLLAGFIQPDQGTVRVFGSAPGSEPFGWLGQRGFWIQGSWADNLRLTCPDASDIAIETALRQVGLGSVLESRAQGIHSEIGEDGQGLSGGQARRLSLARIFLANYDLILLDEPTAGLDATSEILVLEALHKLAESGKTLIFSTHHHALLALADRILIVNDGEVHDA
ncbi:thiol reductant ABC exporter subunit CydD [Marinobacter halophilus]|uniref:Thiol reductant ABC exporter subunit CydD n=1 Tax=Marinobacter halophilus TaxID=1323740 RepID=A0A2T1K974_9GAMM|nr:thiol reductant ABC exporter subunit CydD [Marinobacter halophilus]PSF06323.1 thiol reductant ABC exporter subunit CydD [Marinobacter halophilus]GGC71595.1 cysteine/glutathione ABC transporter membrane protein/ATP-binding protein [Marinobacter halophilus]